MNKKQTVLLLALVGVAVAVGLSRYRHYRQSRPTDPLGTRLTIEYKGTVDGLFQKLSQASGIEYRIAPAARDRPVQGSFTRASIVQIQQEAARQAQLQYRPLDMSGRSIQVDPR